jgi:hypothetical protein
MTRSVVATPLFLQRLRGFLDDYSARGALRFVEKFEHGYRAMVDRLGTFEELGRVRRRTIHGKTVVAREYVLDAGARDFVVLYVVPANEREPVILLNIRIGGQNRFRW